MYSISTRVHTARTAQHAHVMKKTSTLCIYNNIIYLLIRVSYFPFPLWYISQSKCGGKYGSVCSTWCCSVCCVHVCVAQYACARVRVLMCVCVVQHSSVRIVIITISLCSHYPLVRAWVRVLCVCAVRVCCAVRIVNSVYSCVCYIYNNILYYYIVHHTTHSTVWVG